jgi:hypothetical protein
VHSLRPSLIPHIITACLRNGLYPASLYHSNSFVISKKAKDNYNNLNSFHVIVLLDTFSKIIEHTVQSRLASMCRPLGLLSFHQTSTLQDCSTANTSACLSHEIDMIKQSGHHATTAFLDIRGGFDHIQSHILIQRLRDKDTSKYLT